MRPPDSEFVAAVFEGEQPRYSYDVVFFPRNDDGGRKMNIKVNEASATIDIIFYTLFHLHAEESWVNVVAARQTAKRRRVSDWISESLGTVRAYYSARLLTRGDASQSLMFRCGGLFQQYVCDAALKIEDANLRYAEKNQDELRVCEYENLRRLVNDVAEEMGRKPGRVVILPKNRQKGERRMHSNYIDAVTISARTAKPGLFLTLTCNPRWPEIVAALRDVNLEPNQYMHAPDVVVRAFIARVHVLLGDIVTKAVFGRVASWVGVVEFTTTLLPHYHLVIMLQDVDRPRTAEDVDALVSAEIPDEDKHPRAHAAVVRWMIHRPCDGSSPGYDPKCLGDDGRCKHGFPFAFRNETLVGKKVPLLRRRETEKIWHERFRCYVDNRWVVSYNVKMVLRMDCHMHSIVCGDNMGWQYLFGYVMKEGTGQYAQGSMMRSVRNSTGSLLVWDEIEHYRQLRMLGPYESIFHILGEPLVSMSHTVETLPLHLPGRHLVYYRGNPSEITNLERGSKLLAWFDLNQRGSSETRSTLYADIVTDFAYRCGAWVRKAPSNTFGRLMHVNPSPRNMELFHLRLLLLNRPGMTSFEDVLTVDGHTYGTFKDACVALGISSNAGVCYDDAFDEVRQFGNSYHLRRFLAVLAVCCTAENIHELWVKHRLEIADDFVRKGASVECALRRSRDSIMRYIIGLLAAEKDKAEERHEMLRSFITDLTLPRQDNNGIVHEIVLDDIENFRMDGLAENEGEVETPTAEDEENVSAYVDPPQHFEVYYNSYSGEQRLVHDILMSTVLGGNGGNFIILQAAAGCGKTFVYNGLLEDCNRRKLPVVACAMTAIAALLLRDGDTAHKLFGIPIRSRVDGTERSYLDSESPTAMSLLASRLIVVDEVSMMAIWQAELIDNLLRDLTGHRDILFGGKVVLFGGDMAQIGPVLRGVSQTVVTSHCLPMWKNWKHGRRLSLENNRRAVSSPRFAAWLRTIRDGSANIPNTDDVVLPDEYVLKVNQKDIPTTRQYQELRNKKLIDALIDKVYDNFQEDRLCKSVIMCPTNASARSINQIILHTLPSSSPIVSFFATTRLVEEDVAPPSRLVFNGEEARADCIDQAETGGFNAVQEQLDSIQAANLPPHHLQLKVGCIVMLLKNFSKRDGLCNGTRLMVTGIFKHVVRVRRITAFRGQKDSVFFPRLWLRSDDVPVAGSIQRLQFPFSLAFAITINKAQGQTFEYVGLFLDMPVFSHGQFYVAVSRGTDGKKIFIVVIPNRNQGPIGGVMTTRGSKARMKTKNIVIQKLLV